MAYFSNYTAVIRYSEQWCNRCVHGPNLDANPSAACPIMTLHFVWNLDQLGKSEGGTVKQKALHVFILEVMVMGVKYPDQCRMFFEAPK